MSELPQLEQEEVIEALSRSPEVAPAFESDGGPDEAGEANLGSDRNAPIYVYALGQIKPHFPTPAVQKEFAQAAGRAGTVGLTDHQTVHAVLSERQNRYLARHVCWVFSIEGLETYVLHPWDPLDLDLLLEALRPDPRPTDVDVVIGVLGSFAPPEVCNGLAARVVYFDQLYSFDLDSLVKSIPRPQKIKAVDFEAAATEIFLNILRTTDNAGATDEDRARNYLAVRYPMIYELAAERFAANETPSAVHVRPSRLSGARLIADVTFSYTNRQTDVTSKYLVRVDVTEEFPFLTSKLTPYIDH